jgi:hypothetical protein
MGATSEAMRGEAATFLARAPQSARLPFEDDAMRRWLEYRPEPRPGVCLTDLDPHTRKLAHRLLATALRPPAFAQAMTIISLEEVLDRAEGYRRGRHSNDYWVVVFGDPTEDERWGWRFEGHHLSVSMMLDGDTVYPTPVFLGANPHATRYGDMMLVRPLAPEEDLAWALLEELDPAARSAAVVRGTAPPDIHSGTHPRADAGILPLGVAAAELRPATRRLLNRLVAVYTDRLPEDLWVPVDAGELHFAWEGATRRGGGGHYYRVQGPDLLIEFDNTANDANHAHTVLRRPASDFGGDVLAAHRAAHHAADHDLEAPGRAGLG